MRIIDNAVRLHLQAHAVEFANQKFDSYVVEHSGKFKTADGREVKLRARDRVHMRMERDSYDVSSWQVFFKDDYSDVIPITADNAKFVHAHARLLYYRQAGSDNAVVNQLARAQGAPERTGEITPEVRAAATEFESWATSEFREAYTALRAQPDLLKALARYTSIDYEAINGALRNGITNENIAKLDAIAQMFTNTRKLVVWRGAILPTKTLVPLTPKTVVVYPQFLSCSVQRGLAETFASGVNHDYTNVLYEIVIPPGAHFIPFARAALGGANGDETEIILPRNSRLTIRGVKRFLLENGEGVRSYHMTQHVKATLTV